MAQIHMVEEQTGMYRIIQIPLWRFIAAIIFGAFVGSIITFLYMTAALLK